MKVALFDIESHYAPALLEEAMDLVKETTEYDLTEPEPGFYHCFQNNLTITLKWR